MSERDEVAEQLARLAHGVREPEADLAVGRLLERIAETGDVRLRDALVELGARAVLEAVRWGGGSTR